MEALGVIRLDSEGLLKFMCSEPERCKVSGEAFSGFFSFTLGEV